MGSYGKKNAAQAHGTWAANESTGGELGIPRAARAARAGFEGLPALSPAPLGKGSRLFLSFAIGVFFCVPPLTLRDFAAPHSVRLARSAEEMAHAISSAPRPSGFESVRGPQKSEPQGLVSQHQLAESWGFEPQIPLWGILA